MRGLLKASALLAPALATALAVPTVETDVKGPGAVYDHSLALIGVGITSISDDHVKALLFRLEVFPSEQACGYANVTVDGQVLPQTLNGEGSSGVGSVTTERKNVVIGSWSFQCIKVNGQPDSQLMKFSVNSLDGKPSVANGFTSLFRQTGKPEIISIGDDLSVPDQVPANPNPDGLQPVDHDEDNFPQFSIEQEMDELHWLREQMRELEYLIWTKEQAIAEHASTYSEKGLQECDNLICVAKAVIDKAKEAAHHVTDRIHGHHGEYEYDSGEGDFGHFPRPKKPEFPKHGKHGNHTHGPPKHGDRPAWPRPLHWKKPHHRTPPICRCRPLPLPPPHGKPGKHPHYPPPPPPGPPREHGFPHPTPGPHREFPDDEPGRHPHSEHGFDEIRHPHHDDMRPHDGPFDGPPPHEGPYDGPHHGPHDEPHHRPYDGPHDRPHGPAGEAEEPFLFDLGPPGPPVFDGPGPHNPLIRAFHKTKFMIIGVLVSLLLIALHRRACTPSKRADRLARREERHRRRALRRSARKHAIARFLASLRGNESADDDDDYEEKRQALLASAEDGMSTTMTEEITEFRNAAEVVDDLVAESSRSQARIITVPVSVATSSVGSEERPLMRDFDLGSQVGDGEELPAYEDNDGSEMSSVVADGFRYTPGSSEYSPAHSPPGSVSDILGPDTKT